MAKLIGLRVSDSLLEKLNSLRGKESLQKFIRSSLEKSISGEVEKGNQETNELIEITSTQNALA